MCSLRFPLKRWELYQNMMYRGNDDGSFVFMFCFAYPWKYESSILLLSPLLQSKPWVWSVFLLVSLKWFYTMVCKCAFGTCLPLRANIHSHILMFADSLCLPETLSVCPNLSDQKGVTFGLWSHLSESPVTIIHRSSERSAEKGRIFPSSLLPNSLCFRHIWRHENGRCLEGDPSSVAGQY